MFVFSDITKVADFWSIKVDVSVTQGVSHLIHIFSEPSLGKL